MIHTILLGVLGLLMLTPIGSHSVYADSDRDAMHVVMVDLCWTGGLTEGRKIAAMAETYHRPFAPHDCIGPVGFIAGVHAAFSQPNTLIMESVRAFYRGWYNELVTALPTIKDGYVYPMEGPGLGVDLSPAVFARSDSLTEVGAVAGNGLTSTLRAGGLVQRRPERVANSVRI